MKGWVGLLVLAALPLGCSAAIPPGAPPDPATSVTPAPPPSPRATPTPPPSPQVTPRVGNEEQATRDVNARLARTSQVVDQIDVSKLAGGQREMLSGIQDFMMKALAALQAKDLPRARILADKASLLADDLASSLKTGK